MKGFVSFLKYNNAIPLAVTFLMIGAASTYAATNPETFVQKEEKVISIDNTYIAGVNLKKYTPTAQVTAVKEDDDFYYVTYTFKTIALVDYVWQKVTTEEVMQVGKTRLGKHRDLGLFVTEQLRQKIAGELLRLKETQAIEKKNISQKKVATVYKGLIGGFLDSKTETIKGYKPVVDESPEEEEEEQTFARPDPNAMAKKLAEKERLALLAKQKEQEKEQEIVSDEEVGTTTPEEEVDDIDGDTEDATDEDDNNDDTSTSTPGTSGGGSGGSGSATTTPTNKKPVLTILGNNPARVALGGNYVDLGATVSDDHDLDNTVEVYLDDVLVESIVIDTSVVGTYTVMYESIDSDGAIAQKVRTVEVYDPDPVEEESEEEVGTTTPPVEAPPEPTPEEENNTNTPETSNPTQQTNTSASDESESPQVSQSTNQPQNQQSASSTGQ